MFVKERKHEMTFDKRFTWQANIKAMTELQKFIGELAKRYTKTPFRQLVWSLELMCSRYGIVFTAESIKNHKAEAELALIRYGRRQAL